MKYDGEGRRLICIRHCRSWWLIAMLALGACASLPTDFPRPESYAFVDTGNTSLGRGIAAEMARHPGQSGFRLLSNGLDAFVARAVLAQAAQRSIDVQYYLYHSDLTGKLFTSLLLRAADRGVRVRLLVDDMGLEGRDFSAAALNRHPNIEVRIINPFIRGESRLFQFITRLGEVTRRMHNKSFTVDNQITILGGRNIGNEYFDADPALVFSDLDVMAIGPVVRRTSEVFDLYWNSALSYPVSVLIDRTPSDSEVSRVRQALQQFATDQESSAYLQAARNSALATELRKQEIRFEWGTADIVYDQPDKLLASRDRTDLHLSKQIQPHFYGIQRELIIFSPYFVPGKRGVAWLRSLARRGVRVRVLTNSLASTDVGVVHAGYSKYRVPLLRAGVELYELNRPLDGQQRKEKKGLEGSSKASLHAKSFVIDRDRVFIGSLNLDPRSIVENTEIGVVINSPTIAGGMAEQFDKRVDLVAFRLELVRDDDGNDAVRWQDRSGDEVRYYDDEPHAGFWRRLGVGLLSVLPIESQL